MNPASQHRSGWTLAPGVYILSAAALLTASFPPFEVPYAAWVALVPLLLLWEQTRSAAVALGQAYSVYVLAFAFAFFWPVLNEFSSHGAWALISLLLLPLAMAVPFAISAPVRYHLSRLHGFLLLFAGSILVEAALLFGPWSFPWLPIGTTQAEAGFVLQFAEIGGVLLLSCWLWILNGILFLAFGAPRHIAIRLVAAAVAVAFVYGSYEGGNWLLDDVTSPTETLTAIMAQPNLPDDQWMDPYDDARVADLIRLSEEALQRDGDRPGLIIWPEMALPVLGQPAGRKQLYDHLQAWVNRHRTPLLTGALTTENGDSQWDRNLHFHKSALFFKHNEAFHRYDQTLALPIVYSSDDVLRIERLHEFWNGATALSTFSIDQAGFGVLLDIEAWLGRHARSQVTDETRFLVILTRSGWWSNTPGFGSRLSHAQIRAVETRRTVVQVANRGLSGVVLPDGTIDTEIATRGAWQVEVPLSSSDTMYTRIGDWPAALAGIILVLVGLRVVFVALGRK